MYECSQGPRGLCTANVIAQIHKYFSQFVFLFTKCCFFSHNFPLFFCLKHYGPDSQIFLFSHNFFLFFASNTMTRIHTYFFFLRHFLFVFHSVILLDRKIFCSSSQFFFCFYLISFVAKISFSAILSKK